MPRMLIHWLITTLTILMIPKVISGVHVDGIATALAAAAILGVLNAILRPILILLTLPLTFLSLGLFVLVINAGLFELAGSLVNGFRVDSFSAAFLSALIVSVISGVMNSRFERRDGNFRVVVRRQMNRRKEDERPTRTIDV